MVVHRHPLRGSLRQDGDTPPSSACAPLMVGFTIEKPFGLTGKVGKVGGLEGWRVGELVFI